MLKIKDLIPTQNSIRNHEKCAEIVKYLREGKLFRTNPIRLTRFTDVVNSFYKSTSLYIHDGHHRLAAMDYCGLEHLYPDEYYIKDYTFKDYMEPNLEAGWVTPFDPRTHVRLADLSDFKNTWFNRNIYSHESMLMLNSPSFSEIRLSHSISDCYNKNKLEKHL